MRLILGSASPRRQALLAQIGVVPDKIQPANIDETPQTQELPRAYVARMALEKAQVIARLNSEQSDFGDVVLTADTVVCAGRRILDKTESPAQARQTLTLLSGRRHRVMTAICVLTKGQYRQRVVESQVKFKRLSVEEIEWYLKTEEWRGKAGSYAIQGQAAAFIPWMQGSYTNIVGLPLVETANLLRSAQIPVTQMAS